MTRKMTATEVRAKMFALLDDVGRGEEVEITKHGRTVARLVPARGLESLRGKLAGVALSSDRDEELFSTGQDWNLQSPSGDRTIC